MKMICKGCAGVQIGNDRGVNGLTYHLRCPRCKALKPHVCRPDDFKIEAFPQVKHGAADASAGKVMSLPWAAPEFLPVVHHEREKP